MSTVDLELVTETDEFNPVAGDLRVSGRALVRIDEAAAVAQECDVRLKWWLGEWFLDTTQGVPYREQIFRAGVDEDVVRRVLRTSALDLVPDLAPHPTVGVSLDRSTRLASVDVEGETVDGEDVALSSSLGGG